MRAGSNSGVRAWFGWLVIAVVVAARVAAADPDPAAGDAAFKRGRDLLKAGKTAGACAAFEDSLRFDFQYGTLYNLAGCDDKLGKLVAAWNAYHRLATEDPNAARRTKAVALADKLAARVARIVVAVDAHPDHLVVTLDDADITTGLGVEIAVEPGPHVVVAKAPGFDDVRATGDARPGSVLTSALELVATKPPARPDPVTPVEVAPARALASPSLQVVETHRTGHPTAGKIMILGGVSTVVVSMIAGLAIQSEYNKHKRAYEASGNIADANAANDDLAKADGATAIAVCGTVVGIVGIVLWKTSTRVITVRPHVAPNGAAAGIVLGGTF